MVDATQQQQDTQNQQGKSFDDSQSQNQYDQGFQSLIGQSLPQGLDQTSQIVQAYFESVETQIRTARRVTEVWATSMILQQTRQAIVQEVTKQVLAQLRRDPAMSSSRS